MKPSKIQLHLVATAMIAAGCASLSAQTFHPVPETELREKPIAPAMVKAPFVYDGQDSGAGGAVQYRPADAMTARDREVEANAESSIAEHTRYSNLEFNTGNWTYEQVICSAFPEHMFLRFVRNNGTGDVSLFTASIPRNNEGRVRIVPIQMRGYSLFSPAPINALTISAFNHIRREENPEHAPVSGWMATGLCYAALAGGHPQLPPVIADTTKAKAIALDRGMLAIPGDGGATISFDDLSRAPRPMHWTMIFDKSGKLVKATHTSAEMLQVEAIHPGELNPKGTRISAAAVQSQVEKIPPMPVPLPMQPVPPPPPVKDFAPIAVVPGGNGTAAPQTTN